MDRKADRVARDLLSRVVSGELSVGTLLPKELELAAEYGVNRGVVREAIKLLEVHRLVRPIKRRGTEILDPMASISPAVLAAMIEPVPGRVDREMLAELLEVRALIDQEMSRLACQRRSEEDLEALEAALAWLGAAAGDAEIAREAHRALALALARATHNRVFEMLVHWNAHVQEEHGNVFRAVQPVGQAHLQGFEMLVAMVRAGAADEAAALVAAYHRWSIPRLLAAAALRSGEGLEQIMEEAR
ncbi:MAG: GntR family transcriptional regulator [Myxococcales bacterium]|nr:GntR family transcriptional regulator [Myxococcales bacterium]